MDDHIKVDISPFDMLPRSLTAEFGLVCSGVYARIRGFANQYGICSASHETIAKDLGLSRPTVHKWIKVLVKNNYLDDITPDAKNRSHKYAVTPRLEYAGNLTVKEFYSSVKPQEPDGVKDIDTTVKTIDSPAVKTVDTTVKKIYTKRSIKNKSQDINENNKPLAHRQKQVLQRELENHFSLITNLALPKRETDVEKKAGAKRWWKPLWEMLELAEWNINDAKLACALILKEYDKEQLDYDSPASFMRSYRSMIAKAKRGIMPGRQPRAINAIQNALRKEVFNETNEANEDH